MFQMIMVEGQVKKEIFIVTRISPLHGTGKPGIADAGF
jgi:hypothetical protein